MKIGYGITHWSSPTLSETLATIPEGSPKVVLNLKQHNLTLAAGWNRLAGYLLATNDVAIIMNDDVILREDTGHKLAWAITEGQFIKAKPHLSYESDWPNGEHPELLLISARHAAPSDARTNQADYTLLAAAKPKWQPGPDFACFAMTKKLFEEVGLFDESFGVYHEDNDMHRRIQLAGFEAGAFAPYWHYLNGTIRNDPERQRAAHALFEKSRTAYIEKWGGYLGSERYTVPYGS